MNILLWVAQSLMALIFLYSGSCKSYFPQSKLVEMGQTGVAGLPLPFIRFIGLSEIAGAIGLILPWALSIYPWLTPVSALCLAFIMPFAAVIHFKFREYKNVATNIVVLAVCIFIVVGRWD